MSTPDCIRTASNRYALITRMIEEATACHDSERAALLLGMAREETNNVTTMLRQFLARKTPAHELSRKAVA